jgi:hypothetical protein
MDSWFVPKEIRERHGWSAGSELMFEDLGDDSPVTRRRRRLLRRDVASPCRGYLFRRGPGRSGEALGLGLRRTEDPAGGPDRLYRISGPDHDSEEESLVDLLKSGRERRPAIAIDLGGTVEDTWQSKRRWFAAKGFDLGPWPRSRKEVIQIIGGRAALYEQMVSDVYNDTNILSREPVEGVASALKALATQFSIIIVSSRSDRQRATTLEWLRRHHLCIFVSDMALIGEDTNKLAWCLRAGVLFLIDDDPRHLEPGDTIPALTRVHFSGRPIDALRMRERIVVAGTWQDIVTIVTARQIARTSIPAGIRADQ